MFEELLVFLVILLASILQGFSGFGLGLVLMAVLPFFMTAKSATVIVSVSAVFICLYMVWRNRKNLNIRLIAFPLVSSFLFIPLGVYFLNYLDEALLKICLGVLLVLISTMYLVRERHEVKIKPNSRNGFLTGVVSGILGGLLAIGGPPHVIYFIQVAKDKYEYKASLDFIFLMTSLYRLIWLFVFGNLTISMLPLLSGAIVFGLVGTIIGFRILVNTEKTLITKAVYIIMILAGMCLIFI